MFAEIMCLLNGIFHSFKFLNTIIALVFLLLPRSLKGKYICSAGLLSVWLNTDRTDRLSSISKELLNRFLEIYISTTVFLVPFLKIDKAKSLKKEAFA